MTETVATTEEGTRIDYSASSGAGAAHTRGWDAEAPREDDGRNETVTKFNPEEASTSKEAHFQRLRKRQDGDEDLDGTTRRAADRRRDVATWCSQLECTEYQSRRVVYLLDQLDVQSLGPYSAEHAILGLIVLVTGDDGRSLLYDSGRGTRADRHTAVKEVGDPETDGNGTATRVDDSRLDENGVEDTPASTRSPEVTHGLAMLIDEASTPQIEPDSTFEEICEQCEVTPMEVERITGLLDERLDWQ
ncbi:hypothetical protein [Halomicrobium sp. LC1Hm]|uniref:hypothetical protein n=1 Tax=Halomicrobium sp. LC1Hm TaxID=2610902 RepID=UPI0012984946|nr:hypothetical protein [Halomicrobium sp. LC1Hm]QGA82765.1 hypothetical protein LC1Hm_1721 [Halomicrobium sp. LC1Hm]